MNVTPERIIDILADQLGMDANNIGLEDTLVEDLGMDSLELVTVQTRLDDEFDVDVDDKDFLKCETVNDVLKLMRDLLDFSEPLGETTACDGDTCESCQ